MILKANDRTILFIYIYIKSCEIFYFLGVDEINKY